MTTIPTQNTKDADLDTIHAMSVYGGSFAKTIAQAAYIADSVNYSKLKTAFPELWTEFKGFVNPSKNSWLDLN